MRGVYVFSAKSYLRELNPKPIAYEAIALPIELR